MSHCCTIGTNTPPANSALRLNKTKARRTLEARDWKGWLRENELSVPIISLLMLLAVLVLVVMIALTLAGNGEEEAVAVAADRTASRASTEKRFKDLNDWYITVSSSSSGIAGQIREAYGDIGLRKPSVSDFARGCPIARLSGYAHPKPSYLSYADTVSAIGYTERDEYDIGIAYVLTELDSVRQRTWCNKIVELHNLDPWDGKQVPWPK